MPKSRLLTTIVLASIMALLIAACVQRQEDDTSPGDRTVPTPVPTEPGDSEDVPTPEPTPDPTPTAEPEETPDTGEHDIWYELITSEKTYPQERIGENILELAENPEEFGRLWSWFEFDPSGPYPELDWDGRVVLFAGTGESSGCPVVIDSVSFDEDTDLIKVATKRDVPEDTMCTMDWTPRVFVLALEDRLLEHEELRAVIYDTEVIDQIDPEDGEMIRSVD